MLSLTFILLAASVMDHVNAERAGARVQQAQCCAVDERRAQHREVESLQPTACAPVRVAAVSSQEASR